MSNHIKEFWGGFKNGFRRGYNNAEANPWITATVVILIAAILVLWFFSWG